MSCIPQLDQEAHRPITVSGRSVSTVYLDGQGRRRYRTHFHRWRNRSALLKPTASGFDPHRDRGRHINSGARSGHRRAHQGRIRHHRGA